MPKQNLCEKQDKKKKLIKAKMGNTNGKKVLSGNPSIA